MKESDAEQRAKVSNNEKINASKEFQTSVQQCKEFKYDYLKM